MDRHQRWVSGCERVVLPPRTAWQYQVTMTHELLTYGQVGDVSSSSSSILWIEVWQEHLQAASELKYLPTSLSSHHYLVFQFFPTNLFQNYSKLNSALVDSWS